MKRCRQWPTLLFSGMTIAAVALVPVHAADAPPRAGATCDRACLNGFVDRYLDALVAHDPGRLPLARDVRFTENTVRLNLGEALWETASGVGAYKIYLADPYSNQAGFIGVVMENGAPKLLALRLLIKDGRIREIETIIARSGLLGDFPAETSTRQAKPIWSETLKPTERSARLAMVAATNQYFEGMEQNTGEVVPFDASCNRTENGVQTTNNPSLKPPPGVPPAAGGVNIGAMGCKEQFNLGGVNIYSTPERRFWMVDEERGLVLGVFMFTIKSAHAAIPIAELFKVKNGRLYEIEAVGVMGTGLPYGARSGW